MKRKGCFKWAVTGYVIGLLVGITLPTVSRMSLGAWWVSAVGMMVVHAWLWVRAIDADKENEI